MIMHSYPRILQKLQSQAWAITPAAMESIRAFLKQAAAGNFQPAQTLKREPGAISVDGSGYDELSGLYLAPGGVAVIQVFGVIGKRLGWIDTACAGGFDLLQLESDLAAAGASSLVQSVVIHFDTPGGSVVGLPEAHAKIRALAETKPVVGFTDSECCSAGVYLAAACDAFYSTKSAVTGSIGTIMAWVDSTERMAKEGDRLMCFQGGAYKAAGHEGRELSEPERAMFQSRVDACYADFKSVILAARPGYSDALMQGQCMTGAEAAANGLVTALVPDLDAVVNALNSGQ